jgi:hypothetical protein
MTFTPLGGLGGRMRKQEELTNPKSCLNKAKDDEWLFVLLGRDAAAVETVLFWCRKRVELRLNTPDDPQIREAMAWCRTVARENLLNLKL